MREIKFRAWDKINNRWYDFSNGWFEFEFKGEKCIANSDLSDNIILTQFTELTDKNGKEIFEGDILEENVDWLGKGIKSFKLRFTCEHNLLHSTSEFVFRCIGSGDSIRLDKAEVIGNIYENPELLEEKNKK